MQRGVLAMAVVAMFCVTLAACGGSDDGGGSSDGGTDDSGGSAEPVTIEHRYGSTTFEQPPTRIVSLDNQWTDVLVALDAPLVGAALDPVIEGGRYPWQDVIPDSVEGIPVSSAIPYEAVARLDPDLIVVSWAATSEGDFERLEQIAPTIPLLDDEEVDAWQDIATVVGDVLGEPDAAQALIADYDQLVADLAAELPGLDGKTYVLANYVPGDAIHVVADPDDGSATFFAELGLQIDPDIVAIADGASGRAELSLERVDALDADLLLILTNGEDPSEIPGYDLLPAVQDDAAVMLDLAVATALNTPTPLSIPYAIDEIRPALAAAAG